jgi:GGDEF domain-containing protein
MPERFRADPVVSIGQVNEFARERDHHPGGHRHSPYPDNPPPVECEVADVASILGLPDQAVTPAALAAITGLLAELDRLRQEHDRLVGRIDHLERLADHDPVVPALNRRGFMRELDQHLAAGSIGGTLALLYVAGIESMAETHGQTCADAALRHVCDHLVGALRTTDPLGLIGGSSFAMLLISTGLDDTRGKMRAVMERINQRSFVWQGQPIRFAMFTGYHTLIPDEDGETALAAADHARRGRLADPPSC